MAPTFDILNLTENQMYALNRINWAQGISASGVQRVPSNSYGERALVQDTVDINDKPKMSKGKKIILGVGAAALALVGAFFIKGAKKTDYITRAQRTFQETFMRDDISREETVRLLKEYKEIYKISDKEEFFNALFESAKKNFGLSHLTFNIKKVPLKKREIAAMGPDGTFTVNENMELNKDFIVNVIFHEFRHAKQNELMCSKDVERYLSGIYSRSESMLKQKDKEYCERIREMAKNTKGKPFTEKEIEEMVNEALKCKWVRVLKRNLVDELQLGKSEVPDSMSEYLEKCFTAHEKYSNSSFFGYFCNFLEKDARKSGKGMRKILRSIPDNLE